jgi:hypothetical protein
VVPEYLFALWERNYRTKIKITVFWHKILIEIYGAFRKQHPVTKCTVNET